MASSIWSDGEQWRSTGLGYSTLLPRHSRSGSHGSLSRRRPAKWAYRAAVEATGFATSKIGCPCEAGIEQSLGPEDTPDGRTGCSILICAEKKNMRSNVTGRISQCILPAPTASAFDGFPDADARFHIRMHYFGDQYEERCTVGGRSCWKIPVMEGEYVGEEGFGTVKGIAGGNFLVMGRDRRSALSGAEAARDVITGMPGVIASFAGGIVGSGSKVGCANYRFPIAGKHQPSLVSRPEEPHPRFAGP